MTYLLVGANTTVSKTFFCTDVKVNFLYTLSVLLKVMF